jgi:hypothetical protein
MMKFRSPILAGLTALLVSGVGCAFSPAPRRGYAAVDVTVEQAGVRLLRKGMTVCLIRTQLPNVEAWKVISRNTEIVIKSRGDYGPAAVELFDTQTGVLKGRVMAYVIQNGQPEWAQGFED